MAQTKPRPTIAEVQERARERLRSEGWLPDLMKRGFVHEDPRRIQDGRKLDKAARNALIEGAKNDRRRLRDAIEKQLAVTPRAFANLLIGLGLHEPRTRRR